MVINLGSRVQLCCGEEGTLQANIAGMCGECSQCLGHIRFALLTACVLSWSTLLGLQVALLGTKVGPGLHALPRFKPLRFRFSGTPQRHRLLWACVLAYFWARTAQVRAAQATRCLESALSPGGRCVLSPPGPSPCVSWVRSGNASQVCHMSHLGTDLWLRPSWQMSTVQDPGKIWLATGSLLAVW